MDVKPLQDKGPWQEYRKAWIDADRQLVESLGADNPRLYTERQRLRASYGIEGSINEQR